MHVVVALWGEVDVAIVSIPKHTLKDFDMVDRKFSWKGPLCMLVTQNIAEYVFFIERCNACISKWYRMVGIKYNAFFISTAITII